MTTMDTFLEAPPGGVMRTRRTAAEALRRAAARAAGRTPVVRPTRPVARRAVPAAVARLPELEPAEPAPAPVQRKPLVAIDMHSDAVKDEATRPAEREETKSEVAKLTVYALNGILMLMAFPIGFALLVFNILGGENLRTTAHAIALTGLGTALSAATGTGTALFGI
jgi:hypothetical protein